MAPGCVDADRPQAAVRLAGHPDLVWGHSAGSTHASADRWHSGAVGFAGLVAVRHAPRCQRSAVLAAAPLDVAPCRQSIVVGQGGHCDRCGKALVFAHFALTCPTPTCMALAAMGLVAPLGPRVLEGTAAGSE